MPKDKRNVKSPAVHLPLEQALANVCNQSFVDTILLLFAH
jgi:hypothetical protein